MGPVCLVKTGDKLYSVCVNCQVQHYFKSELHDFTFLSYIPTYLLFHTTATSNFAKIIPNNYNDR